MNDRIKELEKLAYMAGYKHPDAVGSCEDYAYFSLTKFAELIIKECIEHCQNQIMTKEDATAERLEYNDGVTDCILALRLHFGEDIP